MDGKIKAGFGLEIQSYLDYDMTARIMEYDCAKYVNQSKEKDKYPIYSLVLYFGRNRWTCPTLLSKRYNPLEDVPFQDYRSNVLDLPRLSDSYLNLFHGDLKFICELLEMEYEERPLKEIRKKMGNVHLEFKEEVLDLLRVLMKDDRFETVQEELYNQREEEDNMCWILDAAEEEGRRKERILQQKRLEELRKESKERK